MGAVGSGAAGGDEPPLVGRTGELDRLCDWLDGVTAGRSRPLLVEGEPGIGKTSLLRATRARALRRDIRTVCLTGIQPAVSLALAGLAALVAALHSDIERDLAAAPPRLTLDDPGAVANPVTLTSELVQLLAEAAEQQPIVVIIDDGQWIDTTSADVLCGALRGLELDRVGLLVAARSGEAHAFAGLDCLKVVGVSSNAAAEMFAPMGIDDRVLTRCWEATGGNPLALDVVLHSLDDSERRGARPLPDPVPVADSIASAFRGRLEALPTATFDALVVLASDTTTSPTALPIALGLVGCDLRDLEPAEEVAIVVNRGGRPSFVHPLLRASTLAMAPAPQVRAACTALAAAHLDAGELEPRAWQLAAAARGPDDEAAAALADVAEAARQRGATVVAADAFRMAARLSTSRADRAARLLAAGYASWVGGRVEEATAVLHEALECSDTARERADVIVPLGFIEMWAHGPRFARDRFLGAVGELEDDDPSLTARLLAHAAATAIASGDIRGALPLARRGMALAGPDDLSLQVLTTVTLGYLEAQGGDAAGLARLEPIIEMAQLFLDSEDADVVGLLGIIGMCLAEAERLEQSELHLAAVVRRSRREGADASGALAAAVLAEKHWRTGNWLEAAHLASTDIAGGAEMAVNAAWAAAFIAHLDAATGREQLCRERVACATVGAAETGADVVLIWAGHALGLLELGARRWPEAAEHLDRVAALTESLGRHLPGAVWWQGDHIEVLVRAGRHADAEQAMRRLDRERSAGTQDWPACVAARGRGMLAVDLDEASGELLRSIELAEKIPAPFEAARSHLVLGERLLATGQVEAGTKHLRDALATFEVLGAAAFAMTARTLLGAPVPDSSALGLAELLSPAELRVALAVSKGATNREVGAELFVSAKTVDYHLQNVYRKLGLRSRTQLAVRVARASPT